MLEHGGRLRRAAVEYGIPLAEWLDLSTGINPNGWPVPTLPPEVWQRLPEDDDGLSEAACAYYGARHALAVAGSQAAIQALPRLYRQLHGPCRVGVAAPGYAEHAHAWGTAGHEVVQLRHSREIWNPGRLSDCCSTASLMNALDSRFLGNDGAPIDVLVLIHPNNPTGQRYELETLLAWHERLAARGGWLVIDEAFMDCTPEFSLAAHAHLPGLIVLRSLGKFFGLAGARVGFVLAEAALLARLQDLIGPWALNGPARHIASLALRDAAWQAAARPKLIAAGRRLADLLTHHGLPPDGGCALFQWLEVDGPATGTPRAGEIHAALARRGILTRLFEAHPGAPYPQGARRFRKAAEPPTAPLYPQGARRFRKAAEPPTAPLYPQGARRFRKAAEPPTAPLPGLRFGLPGGEAGWNRLGAAMREVMA